MKTNTSLAKLSFDIAVAKKALATVRNLQSDLKDLEKEYFCTYPTTSGVFYTAWARLVDANINLTRSISNLQRRARALRLAKKSASVTRASNRTLTGIG